MRKQVGVWFTLIDCFNLLLLPLLVLVAVSMLIWGGILGLWLMITSSLNLTRTKQHLYFHQD